MSPQAKRLPVARREIGNSSRYPTSNLVTLTRNWRRINEVPQLGHPEGTEFILREGSLPKQWMKAKNTEARE